MIYKKHLMSIAFQYYAILEAEKKVLMAWQRQEEHKCLQLVAHAQETFNIKYVRVEYSY
jgi:hypothetical protein